MYITNIESTAVYTKNMLDKNLYHVPKPWSTPQLNSYMMEIFLNSEDKESLSLKLSRSQKKQVFTMKVFSQIL